MWCSGLALGWWVPGRPYPQGLPGITWQCPCPASASLPVVCPTSSGGWAHPSCPLGHPLPLALPRLCLLSASGCHARPSLHAQNRCPLRGLCCPALPAALCHSPRVLRLSPQDPASARRGVWTVPPRAPLPRCPPPTPGDGPFPEPTLNLRFRNLLLRWLPAPAIRSRSSARNWASVSELVGDPSGAWPPS